VQLLILAVDVVHHAVPQKDIVDEDLNQHLKVRRKLVAANISLYLPACCMGMPKSFLISSLKSFMQKVMSSYATDSLKILHHSFISQPSAFLYLSFSMEPPPPPFVCVSYIHDII
jgi:hypothetical protein